MPATARRPFFDQIDALEVYFGALAAYSCYFTDPALIDDVFNALEPTSTTAFPSPSEFFTGVHVGVSPRYLFVAISGTSNIPQGLADVLDSAQTTDPNYPGAADHYFQVNADVVWTGIHQLVEDNAQGRLLVVFGHSLGGATAQLLGKRLQLENIVPLRVLTYGSPRVGNRVFADSWAEGELFQFQHDGDPVPFVPPPVWGGFEPAWPLPFPVPAIAGYVHAGHVVGVYDTGQIGREPTFDLPDVIRLLYNGNPVPAHLAGTYVGLLNRNTRGKLPDRFRSGYNRPDLIDFAGTQMERQALLSWPDLPGPPAPVPEFLDPLFRSVGMADLKFTMFFESGVQGWSETLYSTKYSDLTAGLAAADLLATERRKILSAQVELSYVRVNDARNPRLVAFRGYSGAGAFGNLTGNVAPLDAGVEIRCSVASGLRRVLLVRGLADADHSGTGPAGISAGHLAAFQRYRTILRGGVAPFLNQPFAIRRRSLSPAPAPPLPAGVAITAVTDSTRAVVLTFTTLDYNSLIASLNLISVNPRVLVKGAKGDKGINGIWKADTSLPSPTIGLAGAFNSGPWVPGTGRAYAISYTLDDIVDAVLWDDGNRKVGRPFGADRGRRSPRFSVR